MKRTALRPISKKARINIDIWREVKDARKLALDAKFGYIPCELCGGPTSENNELYYPEGHHNDHNRNHNYPSNCRILHRVCNQRIEDENIKDVPSLL